MIRCSSIIPEIKEAFFKCLVCGHSPQLLRVVKGRLLITFLSYFGSPLVLGLFRTCHAMRYMSHVFSFLRHNAQDINLSILLTHVYIVGRIEEPTRCEKSECGARNSMSLIHNRCMYVSPCRLQSSTFYLLQSANVLFRIVIGSGCILCKRFCPL